MLQALSKIGLAPFTYFLIVPLNVFRMFYYLKLQGCILVSCCTKNLFSFTFWNWQLELIDCINFLVKVFDLHFLLSRNGIEQKMNS